MEPSKNTPFSIRYHAINDELEELYSCNDDDPPTPQFEASPSSVADKTKSDKPISILGKYFKVPKGAEKPPEDEQKSTTECSSKETTDSGKRSDNSGSPMRYLSRLGKRTSYLESTSDTSGNVKDGANDTWKFFSGFKEKISQAVEDLKSSRATENVDEKLINKDVSDSEENSIQNELEQISLSSTDNQVSSLASSLQNFDDLPINTNTLANVTTDDREDSDNTISEDSDKKTPVADRIFSKKVLCDDSLEIESGVEAIEETTVVPEKLYSAAPATSQHVRVLPIHRPQTSLIRRIASRITYIPFNLICSSLLLILSFAYNPTYSTWNGFVVGVWAVYCTGCLIDGISSLLGLDVDEETKRKRFENSSTFYPDVSNIKEYKPNNADTYEGWINQYTDGRYDPLTYHISQTVSAFMKLEGNILNISYTRTKIAKRHLWNEKIPKVSFHETKTYDLTGAKVTLLPKGLVSKRQWSKKYPLCLVLKSTKNNVPVHSDDLDMVFGSETSSIDNEEASAPLSEEILQNYTSTDDNNLFSAEIGEQLIETNVLRQRTGRSLTKSENEKAAIISESPIGVKSDDPPLVVNNSPSAFTNETVFKLPEEFVDLEEFPEVEEAAVDDSQTILYIFTRTGRDKYEWYKRICTVLNREEKLTKTKAVDEIMTEYHSKMRESLKSTEMSVLYDPKESDNISDGGSVDSKLKFTKVMDKKLNKEHLTDCHGIFDFIDIEQEFWHYIKKTVEKKKDPNDEPTLSTREAAWLNALLARFLFDAVRDKKIMDFVEKKIQRKLSTIKLPSFMSPLVVSSVVGGQGTPQIRGTGSPRVDDRGLWIDLDFFYDGGFTIMITTQLNLMGLKKNQSDIRHKHPSTASFPTDELILEQPLLDRNVKLVKPAIFDSDCEDTAESSSDDESSPPLPPSPPLPLEINEGNPTSSPELGQSANSGRASKKIIKIVDRITTSRYFQHVTDNKYVKRAMENVSNTDLRLSLEVKGLSGCLALNLPPPPHDRLWFGFRASPKLWLKARPIVGSRVINFSQITNWIEKRLCKEFEKVFVLPNMEDLLLPFLIPSPVDSEC